MGVLAGRCISVRWALALDYTVGFRGRALTKSVAVMTSESARYVGAYNENDNGSTDRGLFQINSVHDDQISPEDAFKAIPNAAYAYKLSNEGQNWSPWAAYGGSRYLLAYTATLLVQATQLWRRKLDRVEEELG